MRISTMTETEVVTFSPEDEKKKKKKKETDVIVHLRKKNRQYTVGNALWYDANSQVLHINSQKKKKNFRET